MRFWIIINSIVLILETIIILLGSFYKHISFGMGLGDVIAFGFVYLIFFLHIFLTFKVKKKRIKLLQKSVDKFFCHNSLDLFRSYNLEKHRI